MVTSLKKICCIVGVLLTGTLFVMCSSNVVEDDIYQDDSLAHVRKTKFLGELNLIPIESGVDSFELRFDVRHSLSKYHQLFVIKKSAGKWKCLEYNYIVSHDAEWPRDYMDFSIDTIWIYNRTPKSGWEEFFTALEKENVYGLPNQNDIPLFDSLIVMADGVGYSVEFANSQTHRHYSFTSPESVIKYYNFPDNERMVNIVRIFDTEIGINQDIKEILKVTSEHGIKLP